MEDYLGKKTFWWLDLLFSGWKNEHFFDWFQSKVKNYLLIQKDNSFDIFYATKEGNVFFKILSLFDNWSCSTTQEILYKNFIYQLSKMEDYLGKKLFLVAGFIILGVKKWTFFRLISIESEELSFNSKR